MAVPEAEQLTPPVGLDERGDTAPLLATLLAKPDSFLALYIRERGQVLLRHHSACCPPSEFDEAFRVFSSDGRNIAKANSVLVPFLKSLGLRDVDALVQKIKDSSGHSVSKEQLRQAVLPALASAWPGDEDAKRAFRVFDTEGLGFIKVTLLKRFLVQAQLGVDDAVLERLIRDHCHIDGDDLINYEEFISSIRQYHLPPPPSPPPNY